MKRTLLALAILGSATAVHATGEYLDSFTTHYKLAANSKFAEKSCGVCHVSDSDFAFNAYGKDMKKGLTDSGKSELDAAFLVSLETLDSDGDGTDNGKEIGAGTFPGDPTSGATAGANASPSPAPAEKKKAAFPPKNGYHPAIVHFPIALFIAGLILDFIGMIRQDKTLLLAGWYNIVLAAITSLGGILSGVFAMALMKLPYRGLIFEHMLYAAGSTVAIWIMVGMRLHRHEKMNLPARLVYYLLAAGCLFTISWAGHLGGVFVYGE
jgi:uncharacterized membrane protein